MLRFRDSLVKCSYKNEIRKFSDEKKIKKRNEDLGNFKSDKIRFIVIRSEILSEQLNVLRSQDQKETMSSVYKVHVFPALYNGKFLGCVATSDIEKGSLILTENSKMCGVPEEIKGSSKWIKILMKSFYQMSKTDQLEYMTLHNKCINIQDYQNCKEEIEKGLEDLKQEVGKIEHDPEKAEKVFKICCIYLSNRFEDGLRFKASRFRHSCKPNAMLTCHCHGDNDLGQIRAISNIKSGQEINLNYKTDPFSGFKNRKYRQKSLFDGFLFVCSCDLCEGDVDIDGNAYEKYIQEAEKLIIDRKSAFDAGRSLGHLYYSIEDSRKEINCYKQMYKIGKTQNIQPIDLYLVLDRGFFAAIFGYQLYKAADIKIDARNFAKAAEKFGKILGKEIIKTRENPNYYKQYYQNSIDKAGY